MTLKYDSDIVRLRNENPNFKQILYASLEEEHNLSGLITGEIFFKDLFYESSHFKTSFDIIVKEYLADSNFIKIFKLIGFAGSGKTTFLKYLQLKSSLRFKYIDFHNAGIPSKNSGSKITNKLIPKHLEKALEAAQNIVNNTNAKNTVTNRIRKALELIIRDINPIEEKLRTDITSFDINQKKQIIDFIKSNSEKLESYKLNDLTKSISRIKDSKGLSRILRNITIKDLIIVYVLGSVLLNIKLNPTLIIFDNLDAIDKEYLTQNFYDNLYDAFLVLNKITQDDTIFQPAIHSFYKNVKFLFCLREANGAVMNSHSQNRQGIIIKAINFQNGLETTDFKKIIELRVNFYLRNFRTDMDKSFNEIIQALYDDEVFRSVIVPIFNFDYRKISEFIYWVVEREQSIKNINESVNLVNIANKNSTIKYGIRGTLYYFLVQFLSETNLFKEKWFFDKSFSKVKNCLSSRMILTYLINKSCLKTSSMLEVQKQDSMKDIKLTNLILNFINIYDYRELVETITEAFLFHERGWTNLLSFRDYRIENIDDLSFLQNEIDQIRKNNLSDKAKQLQLNSVLKEIDDIYISLNPAGFIFIKYIISHYEYFANLIGISKPLFYSDLSKDENGQYKFINDISNIRQKTKEHLKIMDTTYKTKFVEKLKYDEEKYSKSDYTFKHYGKKKLPLDVGQFHSTRILISHIDYLDHFRIYFIKFHLDNTDLKIEINKALSEEILKLIKLFDDIADTRSAHYFGKAFKAQYDRVEKLEFRDFDYRISFLTDAYKKHLNGLSKGYYNYI